MPVASPQTVLSTQEVLDRALQFRQTVAGAKARIQRSGWDWYPYDSLSNLVHVARLFDGGLPAFLDLVREGTTLDLGSGDGELALFLESLGGKMHALDCTRVNQSSMQGLRALTIALDSKLEIHNFDLDRQFVLPRDRYRLILCLGVLYHLKNPYYALEQLSKQSDYCILSTRIADAYQGENVANVPAAYLLDVEELNDDDSNCWIFTEAGLKRLIERTNWDVVSFIAAGDTGVEPADPKRDRRAFCLLRSKFGLGNVKLGAGWHPAEVDGWRWTEKNFSFSISELSPGRPARVTLKLYIADALLQARSPMTIVVSVGGQEVGRHAYDQPGRYEYSVELTAVQTRSTPVQLDCSLSNAVPPDANDTRERALIVAAIDWETL